MKVLFIGGSGNISTACSKLALASGWDVYHLNRGVSAYTPIPGVKLLKADINNTADVQNIIGQLRFDVVANFIAFNVSDVERDFEIFRNKTGQYIFISSASVYQKPVLHPVITESTPLCNPFWEYSRNKIAAEERLNQLYRDYNFPVTIIRPSLTYQYVIPVAIGSWTDYTIIDRMKKGKPVIVHGDGNSLWTITHSEDFARGFVGLMGHQQAAGQAFHITSDEILTWNQIYEAVAEAAGCQANIVHISSDFICEQADRYGWHWMRGNLHGDKAASVIFDNSKIKTFVPGFQASISFKKGIKQTVRWFEEDASRMKILEENNAFMDYVLKAYSRG